MSATNKTAVYELPIFLGTDVPSWLTDWNGAMGDIDTAIAAAKAAADAAASTAGTAATDIVTINGQITSLQNTVGTHTTQIGTISGNINTINSLIGNGTPTTTDQTLIGAINELHADQGNLADLQTTDKSSLVAAINEAAQSGGGSSANIRYNDTDHTIEVEVGGVWYTAISNVYAGTYKGSIIYQITASSTAKILYITVQIVSGQMVYFSTDYVDSITGTTSLRDGYGYEAGSTFSFAASGHFLVTPAVNTKYQALSISCTNDDNAIISAALPITISSMSLGAGTQVDINGGANHINYVSLVES